MHKKKKECKGLMGNIMKQIKNVDINNLFNNNNDEKHNAFCD